MLTAGHIKCEIKEGKHNFAG